ncbi:hypothetical protein U1Q18_022919 [Sarracenia purpurea var. burkii]
MPSTFFLSSAKPNPKYSHNPHKNTLLRHRRSPLAVAAPRLLDTTPCLLDTAPRHLSSRLRRSSPIFSCSSPIVLLRLTFGGRPYTPYVITHALALHK